MMLERKGTERKNQPGYLLIQLSYICTNLENGMEKSVIGVDLKQEANAKVGIDPIRLVNARAHRDSKNQKVDLPKKNLGKKVTINESVE